MKLIRIYESPNLLKKLRAEFRTDDTPAVAGSGSASQSNGRTKHTDFGAKGMSDYTIHKDTERRERYRTRHNKDLKTQDPTRPGFLSYYLLWGDSTNLATNIRRYKQLFNL
jgi:hypothetical protein